MFKLLNRKMSAKAQQLIKDLILIYVRENYNNYLKENKIDKIPENEIKIVIQSIYTDRKTHLKEYLKMSLKSIMEDDYIGDLFVNNICNDIFSDDELCVNRLTLEIKNHQS